MVPADKSASPWLPQESRKKVQAIKREAVLMAAAKTFGERGFRSTRIDDIAAALNVTKPTIYYYFPNKEALFLACLTRSIEKLDAGMAGLTTDDPPDVRVRAFLDVYLALLIGDLGRCLANATPFELKPKSREALMKTKRDVHAQLQELIESGVQQGVFQSPDISVTTSVMFGAMNSLARWQRHSGRLNATELTTQLRDFLMKGLMNQG